MNLSVVIGLSAVIIAIKDGEAVALTVRPHDARTSRASAVSGLPFGPFDPAGHRTFELALRAFVAEQTRFDLGYVEQLYTFGDEGRDAPLADVGAGAARNAGARIARGKHLLFLDADDWLRPTALQKMLAVWNETGAIAYSDYIGHAYIEEKAEIDKLRMRGRLASYDERTKLATVTHQAFEFDCARAQAQPQERPTDHP